MTAPEWYALGAALVVIGAWVAAGTVATREAHGRRDGQDSAPPTSFEVPGGLITPGRPMTEAEVADFKREWAEVMAETRDLRAWRGKEPTNTRETE